MLYTVGNAFSRLLHTFLRIWYAFLTPRVTLITTNTIIYYNILAHRDITDFTIAQSEGIYKEHNNFGLNKFLEIRNKTQILI